MIKRRQLPEASVSSGALPAIVGLALLLAIFTECAVAEVRLPRVIAAHMVLQRDRENPIWGWADPGEEVTVTFGGVARTATADKDGRWRVILPKFQATREGRDLTVTSPGAAELRLPDVLVGEVWFFCGPSNIYWPVERCSNAKQEIAAAQFPGIRFFSTPKKLADEPQQDCEGQWSVCTPKTVGSASGVAYFFSRRLHSELDVPVGVLQSFWGGTRVEGWTSAQAVEAEANLAPVVEWWENAIANYDIGAEREKHRLAVEQWKREVAAAGQQGKRPPSEPRMAVNPAKSMHRPGRLFNGMIAPLIPYGMRGAVTYQGLGNLYWAESGKTLMATMFRDWRNRWQQGDFPIGMIQPAPFPTEGWAKRHPDAYSLQREAQIHLLRELPSMGLAPTMDIINFKNVHFPNKQIVGQRMAHWALAQVYGQQIAQGGPIYESMAIEGDTVRIRFRNTGGKLSTSDGEPPTGFTVAGVDGNFTPAAASVDGDSVLVRSDSVPNPVAVRFVWGDTATSNLVNKEGLPASLFRTDGKKPVGPQQHN